MQMIDRCGHNDCRTLTDAANEIEQLAAECERLKHERNKAAMGERQKWIGKGLLTREQVRPLVEALKEMELNIGPDGDIYCETDHLNFVAKTALAKVKELGIV